MKPQIITQIITQCAYCKRYQWPSGPWNSAVEFAQATDQVANLPWIVTHGICPDCAMEVRVVHDLSQPFNFS